MVAALQLNDLPEPELRPLGPDEAPSILLDPTRLLAEFGDAAVAPVLSTIQHFRGEYEAHVREGRCTCPADWRVMEH